MAFPMIYEGRISSEIWQAGQTGSAMEYIIHVLFPVYRVVGDIFPDGVQRSLIPDDMIVKRTLPDRFTGHVAKSVDTRCYGRFKPLDKSRQRPFAIICRGRRLSARDIHAVLFNDDYTMNMIGHDDIMVYKDLITDISGFV
jgi:hypothetical protein